MIACRKKAIRNIPKDHRNAEEGISKKERRWRFSFALSFKLLDAHTKRKQVSNENQNAANIEKKRKRNDKSEEKEERGIRKKVICFKNFQCA